jgi:hypothetical protein
MRLIKSTGLERNRTWAGANRNSLFGGAEINFQFVRQAGDDFFDDGAIVHSMKFLP